MRPLLIILSFIVVACEIDDLSTVPDNDSAPTIIITSPQFDSDTVIISKPLKIAALFQDSTPILSQGVFEVISNTGLTLFDTTIALVGKRDSVVFDLPPNILTPGLNVLEIAGSDADGMVNNSAITFTARNLNSIYDQIYVLGTFNGFGDNNPDMSMTLIDDHIWQIENVELESNDRFKFTADLNFEVQFIDPDCDQIANPPGGFDAPDIECGYDGLFTITFNELTGEYNLFGEQNFKSAFDQIYLLGSMNNWGQNTPDQSMTLVADHLWMIENVSFTATDEFKIVGDLSFFPQWIDPDCDRRAKEPDAGFGNDPNIACGYSGVLSVSFNDTSFIYNIFERNEESMFLLGSMNSWSQNDPDQQMLQVGDHLWQVRDIVFQSDSEFKFTTDLNFSKEFIDPECDFQASLPEGFESPNIACPEYNGTRVVTFNDETLEYTVE